MPRKKNNVTYVLRYDKDGNSYRAITNGSVSIIFKIDESTWSYRIIELLSGRVLKVRIGCVSKAAMIRNLRLDVDVIMKTYNSEKLEAWGISLSKKQKRLL